MSYARRRSIDIWPGFVDALAALLMVVVFVIMIFAFAQFFMTDALQGKDRALANLNARIAELANLLSLEEQTAATLRTSVGELRASLEATASERDALSAQRDELNMQLSAATALTAEQQEALDTQAVQLAALNRDIELLRNLKAELEAEVAALATDLDDSRRDAALQAEVSAEAQAQVTLLNRQLAALREQLDQIAAALDVANQAISERDSEIADLGRRLNLALASKVQQLARFRSEFFGRLKEALGDNPDLRVEGDRFVFQSELLFGSGSAELGDEGRAQVRRLANTLREIAGQIPDDIEWVLRIDGHTDKRPIVTSAFPSNWELSSARALAIVKYMIDLGIPPQRLVAAGFGEYHPIDDRENELAWARNRRIELKLTQR